MLRGRRGDSIKNKKREYTIVKSQHFKEQEKKLPTKVKKELAKALKQIAKDPEHVPRSMAVFAKPSPEELKQWMGRTKIHTIDIVMEYLFTKECLNLKGRKLALAFWKKYIKED